jgi:hypothetical protein
MTLSFYYDFTIYSILISALWIFRDATLVLWARTMKKRVTQSKYINSLHITGIILLTWSILSVFLPGVRLSYSYSPEFESELLMFNTIFCLYIFIPIIIVFLLGVALSLYFYNNYYQHDRKAFLGPQIFLIGNTIYLIFMVITTYIYISNPSLFYEIYELYLIGIVLTSCLLVVGISFIFLYSIYINNDFLIMFCGLFFASQMISLISSINFTIIYFNDLW